MGIEAADTALRCPPTCGNPQCLSRSDRKMTTSMELGIWRINYQRRPDFVLALNQRISQQNQQERSYCLCGHTAIVLCISPDIRTITNHLVHQGRPTFGLPWRHRTPNNLPRAGERAAINRTGSGAHLSRPFSAAGTERRQRQMRLFSRWVKNLSWLLRTWAVVARILRLRESSIKPSRNNVAIPTKFTVQLANVLELLSAITT